MMSCREVARIHASDELASLSLLQRLVVRFHLWMCRPCKQYTVQIRELGETVRRNLDETEPTKLCKESIVQACLCSEKRPKEERPSE